MVSVGPISCLTAREAGEKRDRLLELYELVKTNPTLMEAIDWNKFAAAAELVCLHYDQRFGLMTREGWQALRPFLRESAERDPEIEPTSQ